MIANIVEFQREQQRAPPKHDSPAAARALVVDDHADTRAFLAELLRLEGWEVSLAGDGFEGIRLGLEHSPHLVLLDIWMPGLDGVSTCERMRREPSFGSAVFYAITADLRFRLEWAPCFDGCLSKPIAVDELTRLLTKLRSQQG